jgi:hypothetical protein
MLKSIQAINTPPNTIRWMVEIHTTVRSSQALQTNNAMCLCGYIHHMLKAHSVYNRIHICNRKNEQYVRLQLGKVLMGQRE